MNKNNLEVYYIGVVAEYFIEKFCIENTIVAKNKKKYINGWNLYLKFQKYLKSLEYITDKMQSKEILCDFKDYYGINIFLNNLEKMFTSKKHLFSVFYI